MSRTAAAGKRNRKTGEVISTGQVTQPMMDGWVAEKGVVLRGGGLDESPTCIAACRMCWPRKVTRSKSCTRCNR